MEFPRQAPGRALTTGTAESLSLSEGRPGGTEFGAGTHGVLLVGGPGALGPPLPIHLSAIWDSEKSGFQNKSPTWPCGPHELVCPKQECQLLRILVENQGRISFSWKIQNQQKGLIGPVTLNNIPLQSFTIYSLELKMSFFERLRSVSWKPVPTHSLGPAFYLGTLKAGSSPQDTFLTFPGWDYGFVFINGRNLGRYWNIGPQETLYLPGAWLQPGDNEIVVFEKKKRGPYIHTTDNPRW
ncbi:hypothetical protein J1605_022574 [Eschrichtius robustus]|uniref:Beta-galactosidase-1-like protein 2 n=1 Tax=Eschrichtius robustus TaxID=9764 RepID=A0AB34HC01_ESCRO|nr:hypothetical protein J1605_022574 [Eschrichtius robustus]